MRSARSAASATRPSARASTRRSTAVTSRPRSDGGTPLRAASSRSRTSSGTSPGRQIAAAGVAPAPSRARASAAASSPGRGLDREAERREPLRQRRAQVGLDARAPRGGWGRSAARASRRWRGTSSSSPPARRRCRRARPGTRGPSRSGGGRPRCSSGQAASRASTSSWPARHAPQAVPRALTVRHVDLGVVLRARRRGPPRRARTGRRRGRRPARAGPASPAAGAGGRPWGRCTCARGAARRAPRRAPGAPARSRRVRVRRTPSGPTKSCSTRYRQGRGSCTSTPSRCHVQKRSLTSASSPSGRISRTTL